jgi:hypothetical protein
MVSLDKNKSLDLIYCPTGRNNICSKWVLKKKLNAKGKVEKYKSQLAEKGYSHVEGIEFADNHVSKLNYIILLILN